MLFLLMVSPEELEASLERACSTLFSATTSQASSVGKIY